jgi:uncharacterized ferritin-like protein (DUF455 family)
MKKPHTEAELLTAIDNARAAARIAEIEADALDLKADTLFRHAPTKRELALQWREQAKKKRKRACSLVEKRIPRLGRALSVLRTLPLPGVGGGIRRPTCQMR